MKMSTIVLKCNDEIGGVPITKKLNDLEER